MKNKKTGAYYTPEYLAKFILEHTSKHLREFNSLDILEPSVGDGRFIDSLNQSFFIREQKVSFFGIEKSKKELQKAITLSKQKSSFFKFQFQKRDFLEYCLHSRKKFSLIVGNPPYIKKSFLTKKQISLCKKISDEAKFITNSVVNIWPYFILGGIKLLRKDGVIGMVLPAEFLQLNYCVSLREYLMKEFERIEVFTFHQLVFKDLGQDTILLFCYKNSTNKGLYYSSIKNQDELKNKSFTLSTNNLLVKSNLKWSHHTLTLDEISLVNNLSKRFNSISKYCTSKPGIVTAANKFFIVDKSIEEKYSLEEFTKPIIEKAIFVNGGVVFNRKDFEALTSDRKKNLLLSLPNEKEASFNEGTIKYLKIGKSLNIHTRYKCLNREKWFSVPNVRTPSQAFFLRRIYNYPKLIKNDAKVLVTDTAYEINMNEDYQINSLIYCFYNSFTLVQAEIEGRYYGGGVLELTPNEFKSISIPYADISKKEFLEFKKNFQRKESIEELLSTHDLILLGDKMGLSQEEIYQVKAILKKLKLKRQRFEQQQV